MIVALHKSVEELYRTEIDFIDSNNRDVVAKNKKVSEREREKKYKTAAVAIAERKVKVCVMSNSAFTLYFIHRKSEKLRPCCDIFST